MKLSALKFKPFFTILILLAALFVQAQDKTKVIGNKPREGSSNSSFAVIKGQQVGIKMKAGSKPVQLLKLNFGVENRNRDSIKFKVNVYEFYGDTPGENLIRQDIIAAMPKGKNRINVDLSPYNIITKGTILVAIEWLDTYNGSEPAFAIGLFNGGTYRNQTGEWKKMPVAGVDFNVLVKKLK